MKNKAIDLHNHLFEQLERINDTSIKGEELRDEMMRADTMCKLSVQIINNGRMVMDARRMAEEYGLIGLPDMLHGGEQIDVTPKQPKRLIQASKR